MCCSEVYAYRPRAGNWPPWHEVGQVTTSKPLCPATDAPAPSHGATIPSELEPLRRKPLAGLGIDLSPQRIEVAPRNQRENLEPDRQQRACQGRAGEIGRGIARPVGRPAPRRDPRKHRRGSRTSTGRPPDVHSRPRHLPSRRKQDRHVAQLGWPPAATCTDWGRCWHRSPTARGATQRRGRSRRAK